MSLHLLLSTSTDRLIDDLVESLAQAGPATASRPVLLPSRPLVERVRVALARRTGVAMGARFLLPAAFIDTLGQALGQDPLHVSWTPAGMFWRLYGLLDTHKTHKRLAVACADELARVSLARQVADRFDQYLHFRPQLIAAWDQGKPWASLPSSAREDEAWQRLLWDGLRAQLKEHPHPAQRLELLLEKARQAPPGLLAPAIEVLATGPLPTAQLRVLAALGANAEVRLRVLMPSSAYFGDIKSAKAQRYLDLDADPDAEGNPLLAQMGAQARAHLRTLVDLDASGQAIEDLEPTWDEPTTLLQRLQTDIRASQQAPDRAPLDLSLDRSLRAHCCHGPRREIEVLRDELLRAFDELPDLKAEEILILAPDLGVYGPLVKSLLAGTGLPLALAERQTVTSDPIQQVLRGLLSMAAGRCALSEGLDLLEMPATRLALGEDGAEALAERLQVSGITFGLDGAHRQRLQAGAEESGTWRSGLDRLLAGLWLGSEQAGVDAVGLPALPVAGDLGSGSSYGAGLAWMERVLALLLDWQSPATPAQWAQRLDSALRDLFLDRGFDQDLDLQSVDETLDDLRLASLEHGADHPLLAASLLSWMDEYASDDARRVSSVGGAIALGGLKPLRALPCRVLVIVGLKDSAFPRRSQAPAWDLLAAFPQAGDRDARQEDRQLFLDALLAAKDRVILCAPTLSPQTNKAEPLSACVEELLRAASHAATNELGAQTSARAILTQARALQPFHPDNFSVEAASYDGFNAGIANALAPDKKRAEKIFAQAALAVPVAAAQAPDLDGLLRFLRDPASAWLRALSVSPAWTPDEAGGDDAEPLNLDPLQHWQLADAALRSVLAGEEAFLSDRLAADRLLPYGRLGQASGGLVLSRVSALAGDLRARVGAWSPRVLSAQWGAYALSGSLWVADDAKHLVLCGSTSLKKPRVMLAAWTQVCLSAAAGEPKPIWVGGYDRKEGAQLKRLEAVETKAAQKILGQLLELWSRGQSELMPFAPKTSLAIAEATLKSRLEDDPDSAAKKRARAKALAQWQNGFQHKGEGEKPAAALAWRGQEPFEGEGFDAWIDVASRVWEPLLVWWKGVER